MGGHITRAGPGRLLEQWVSTVCSNFGLIATQVTCLNFVEQDANVRAYKDKVSTNNNNVLDAHHVIYLYPIIHEC